MWQPYVTRGEIYLEREDAKNALADFDRALAIKPDFAHAHYDRSVALALLDRGARFNEPNTH